MSVCSCCNKPFAVLAFPKSRTCRRCGLAAIQSNATIMRALEGRRGQRWADQWSEPSDAPTGGAGGR